MSESLSAGRLDDPNVPAGLIFLGQFIDHDVTLDAVSRLAEVTDPAEIQTLRTPRLDLDSVYLDGPEASSYLYDAEHHGRLLTGTEVNPLDLPRNRQGTALIGDPRNDENTVVAQLHQLFLRFHNSVLTDVELGVFDAHRSAEDRDDFEFARRIVRWHYQWIVHEEFLPAVVDRRVLARALDQLEKPQSWCRTNNLPFFPIEFSAAAYRFGHSQIRGTIRLQRQGDTFPLFSRTGGLTSFGAIPVDHNIDWSLFFRTTLAHPQPARLLDPLLAPELLDLPFVASPEARARGEANLAFRNLQRGSLTFELPSGEAAHRFLTERGMTGRPEPLDAHPWITELGIDGTPLWFYCLYEAQENGGKLGDVGGTLVAVTLLRMLTHDPLSYLADEATLEVREYKGRAQAWSTMEAQTGLASQASPAPSLIRRPWQPFLGPKRGEFSMADLVRYVDASEGR